MAQQPDKLPMNILNKICALIVGLYSLLANAQSAKADIIYTNNIGGKPYEIHKQYFTKEECTKITNIFLQILDDHTIYTNVSVGTCGRTEYKAFVLDNNGGSNLVWHFVVSQLDLLGDVDLEICDVALDEAGRTAVLFKTYSFLCCSVVTNKNDLPIRAKADLLRPPGIISSAHFKDSRCVTNAAVVFD